MYQYLKHSYLTCVVLPCAVLVTLFAPAWAMLVPPTITLLHVLLDTLTPPELEVPQYRSTWVLDLWVYLFLPFVLFYFFCFCWLASPTDFLGFGAFMSSLGFDITTPKAGIGFWGLLSNAFAVGYVISSNHLYAHELVHRTRDKLAMLAGRWLLAMSGDAQFSISHVYAHHVHVGTDSDSATARRGESVYRFFVRSSIGQYRESWLLECIRLGAKNQSPWSLRNRVITGCLMSATFAAFAWFAAGALGVILYVYLAMVAKFLFETVNYIEHYGVVRVPGTQVQPRHSWDCNTRAASNALLNLARHADHHAYAQKKYWELRPHNTPLQLSYGYVGTIVVAMIPYWWHRFAIHQLKAWDENSATPDEKVLAAQANLASGHPLFLSLTTPRSHHV